VSRKNEKLQRSAVINFDKSENEQLLYPRSHTSQTYYKTKSLNRSSTNLESESLITEDELEEEEKEKEDIIPFKIPNSAESEHYEINVVTPVDDYVINEINDEMKIKFSRSLTSNYPNSGGF
jgi:hypothetical protein